MGSKFCSTRTQLVLTSALLQLPSALFAGQLPFDRRPLVPLAFANPPPCPPGSSTSPCLILQRSFILPPNQPTTYPPSNLTSTSNSLIQNSLCWCSSSFCMNLWNTFNSARSHSTAFALDLNSLPLAQPSNTRPDKPHEDIWASPCCSSRPMLGFLFHFYFGLFLLVVLPLCNHRSLSTNAHSLVAFQLTSLLPMTGVLSFLGGSISLLRFCNCLAYFQNYHF